MTMNVESTVMRDTSVSDDHLIALMYAVHGANLKWVEALIADGTDANKCVNLLGFQYMPAVTDTFREEESSLIAAIKLLHPKSQCSSDKMMEIFDVLLNSVADVNKLCPLSQRTPIMYAVAFGNVKCVEKLIYKGAALYIADKFGDTVWTLAVKAGNVNVLKCLIEDHGIDKNSVDRHGSKILYSAVRSGNIEVVRYLLNLGVTVTRYISQKRQAQTCDGCNVDQSCYSIYQRQLEDAPYMEAIGKNMPEVVKLLEKHGCQLYKFDEALIHAVQMDSVDVVEYLLCNHKYSLNKEYFARYGDGRQYPHQTLLMLACERNSVKSVKLILEQGGDPRIKRCTDKSPSAINLAIHRVHVEILAHLIRGGVDVNTRSQCEYTGVVLPFEDAVCHNFFKAAELLLLYGCSCGVHSFNNKHYLKTNIHPNLQKLLNRWEVDKNNVLPLKQRCRMVILNHLCPQADKKINELHLPTPLIQYLTIPEFDGYIKMINNYKHNVIYSDIYYDSDIDPDPDIYYDSDSDT